VDLPARISYNPRGDIGGRGGAFEGGRLDQQPLHEMLITLIILMFSVFLAHHTLCSLSEIEMIKAIKNINISKRITPPSRISDSNTVDLGKS
jgi:hypothetical protein